MMSRRLRKRDHLADPISIEQVLMQLKDRCPSLLTFDKRKLERLLAAVRHQQTYSATETNRGRPTKFAAALLEDTAHQLKQILARETGGRVALSTFIGHYLPLLRWPQDVLAALARGELNRLEAAQVARLTAQRLGVREREAARIRAEIMDNHARLQGSQSALRERVREALGELTLVTSEKMTAAVAQVDELLRVDESDRRHLFYEQMKDFFFALREIDPEEIDEETLDLLLRRSDELMDVVYSIQKRRKAKQRPTLPV